MGDKVTVVVFPHLPCCTPAHNIMEQPKISNDSDMRLEKLMAQLMEDYPTASNQRLPRPGPESMSEDERNAPTAASSQGLHQPHHAEI